MKFSELWLREWVNVSLNSEALLSQITLAGFEVDRVEPVSGMFHGVIIGEVVEYRQHPNVNKLWITKVNVGSKNLLNIIYRAENCFQGLKVAVATVGAVLPDNIKIKALKIHGELSEGIFCSYSDLGISDNQNSIIELPLDAPIGTNIRDYLKLDDNIIEINVTPNRADCLSIIGMARDVAALNKIELNIPKITPVVTAINDTLPIQIENINACPRYLGRVVKGINVKAITPLWMKEKLRRCGVRSINTVVNITNYVLLELGQPIRIFDRDGINGGIVIRMASENETLVLANNNEVKLNTNTIVVADYKKVLAICGNLDREYSLINDETQNVLLECAFFSLFSNKSRSLRHSFPIDRSYYLYEHGIDPTLQYKAIERATHLLISICGGKAGPIIDATNESMLPKRSTIILRRSKLDRLIGHHIDDMQVSDILCRLGCNIIKTQNEWKTIVPPWRFDIKLEEDLVEEIIRVYGYNNIPNKPVQANLVMGNHSETDLPLKRVKMLLNDKGYQEVITYSFVDPKIQQLIHPGEEALILKTPISREMSSMRLSLWPGLLGTIIYNQNQNRQQSRMRIFETGLRFVPDVKAGLGVRQDMMLAGAICGNRYEEHWDLEKSSVDFYDMKGDLESILDLTGKFFEIEFRTEMVSALHPGQSAAIYLKGERIGFIGVIHPDLERKLNINNRTIVFEIEWKKVASRVVPQVRNISRFPASRRDIAIVVAENIPAADIWTECKKVSFNQIVDINLFDVYRGKGIPEGFKSITISLILQDISRTLKEEEITDTVSKCVEALKEKFQASLRDLTYGAYKS